MRHVEHCDNGKKVNRDPRQTCSVAGRYRPLDRAPFRVPLTPNPGSPATVLLDVDTEKMVLDAGLTVIMPGIETLDDGKGGSYIVCVRRSHAPHRMTPAERLHARLRECGGVRALRAFRAAVWVARGWVSEALCLT